MKKTINKTFVIGDIHGGHKSLVQVLGCAKFDYKKDRLICLGDVADGWPEVAECFEELLKIKNLVMVRGNHDCLSEDTECLTKSGWKKYTELNSNDFVFSLDTTTRMGQWDKIEKIIVKKTSTLNRLVGNHVDMFCTDNHRVLGKKRTNMRWAEKFDYTEMSKIKGRYQFPVSAVRDSNKEILISDDELRFCAWILTDGGLERSKDSYTGSYKIYQSKPHGIRHIKGLLDMLGYKYSVQIRNVDIKEICGKKLKTQPFPQYVFSILAESAKRIKEYLPSKYPFPLNLLNMSKRQFDIFLKEIILGDGSNYLNRSCSILYGTYVFLSNIQALCVTNGYRAVLAKDNRGTFRLNISNHTDSEMDIYGGKIKKTPGERLVWCLSVPLTNFMVRRNGKAFFTGNSWLLDYLCFGETPDIWIKQGGKNSFLSYQKHPELKEKHRDFLISAPFYYIDEKKRLYVHGGLIPGQNPEEVSPDDLMWSRDLWRLAGQGPVHVPGFKEVYVGHTSIWRYSHIPHTSGNVVFMDTGGGREGKLSIMDVDSKKIFQSDIVSDLYTGLCERCHGSGCVVCEPCKRCNGNGCPICDGTKGSKYNPDGY